MGSGKKAKKTGTKASRDVGIEKQLRGKASKKPTQTGSGSAAREDTGSRGEASAGSSKKTWTSSNAREFEATLNTSSTTYSTAATEISDKAGPELQQLCARCNREMGDNGFIRVAAEQSRKAKIWFYPAAVVMLTITVVTIVYLVLQFGDTDHSEQRYDPDLIQKMTPASKRLCDASLPTDSCEHRPTADGEEKGIATLGEKYEKPKRRNSRRRSRRGTRGTSLLTLEKSAKGTTAGDTTRTVSLPREKNPKGATTGGTTHPSPLLLHNNPKETTTRGYGTPNIVLERTRLTSRTPAFETNLNGTATGVYTTPNLVPRRPSSKTTPFEQNPKETTSGVYTTPNIFLGRTRPSPKTPVVTPVLATSSLFVTPQAMTTIAVSGEMMSQTDEQPSKSSLTSAVITVGAAYGKATTKVQSTETQTENDWEVQKSLETMSDPESLPAGTTVDLMALLANVGAQDAAAYITKKYARGRDDAKRQAAWLGFIRTRVTKESPTTTVFRH